MNTQLHKTPEPHRRAGLETILLVDDDASVRDSLCAVLTGEGYDVVTAENGAQAVELAASHDVALALLDLNMPVKDGWSTLQVLSREHPTLPVALVTARPNQLFPALAAGVAALMEKPLDIPHLLQTIRQLLDEPSYAQSRRSTGQKADFYYKTPRRKAK